MATPDIIASLDAAAADILKRATAQDKDDPISLSEMVRAFDSMAKYAELRLRLKPPKKAEGAKFGQLKRKLHGGKAGSDGDSAEGEES